MLKLLLSVAAFIVRLLWQTVFLAISQVWANKIRAFLTALGIIIGVLGVTIVAAGLEGMQGFVLTQFDGIGARKMWLNGNVPESKKAVLNWSDVKMTTYEAHLILDNAETIESLTPITQTSWVVSNGTKVVQGVPVRGIWPTWHEIENRQVIFGRPFSRIDDAEHRQVCLINELGIEELNLDTDPVGDYLLINGRRFLIVGVVEPEEASMFQGGQAKTELIIPFSTHKMMNPYTWTWFTMNLINAEMSSDAKTEVRFILRNHRKLNPEDEDTFDMFALQSAIENFNSVAVIISWVMRGVVFVSLIVGGIGIMNIMLVSVSERTREIGLRKAMGAKPPVILLQFLVEAVVLCVIGGLVGLFIGNVVIALIVIMMQLLPNVPELSLAIPRWAVILSLSFSALVGVVFGMFPAIKAAMLNPIDALRHD